MEQMPKIGYRRSYGWLAAASILLLLASVGINFYLFNQYTDSEARLAELKKSENFLCDRARKQFLLCLIYVKHVKHLIAAIFFDLRMQFRVVAVRIENFCGGDVGDPAV